MTCKPLGSRLLVEKLEADKEVGGIIIQQSKPEDSFRAKVLAIGSDVTDCFIGDTILLSKYSGCEVDGGILVKEEDVLGKIMEG